MGNYRDRLLIEYLPSVLKDNRAFQAIMYAEQPEVFNLFAEIQNALNNQFILTLMEYGVKRWEKMLNITPNATWTIEERRFTILTRLAEQLPYVIRMLEKMLMELCGADGFKILLDTDAYTLTVKIALSAKNNFNDVIKMLVRVCPANLLIIVEIMYNTHHVLSGFRHGQLSKYKHEELRNEVLG